MTAPPPLTPERFAEMLREWGGLLRKWRREAVRLRVDAAHQGPPVRHDHPTDGATVEVSWAQAQAVHAEVPMVLEEVVDAGAAFFRPATPLDGPVPSVSPAPPY